MIIEDEEVKTEIKFSDREEDSTDSPILSWRNDDSGNDDAAHLFSFDDDPNDLEIQSFSFDFENKKEEQKENSISKNYSDEKAVEFNFTVNEPIVEPKYDFGQPKNEVKSSTVIEKKTEETITHKVETFYQGSEQQKVEEKPTFQHRSEVETSRQTESEFTFVNKPADQERASERRNKLKEFNSRYQNFDHANEFESVPAFKRKNISIDGSNASDQNINTYLSDNNGNMQIRENRFLNKDVD